MWKLLVADDEPKIRRGIKKILDWKEFNIDIVGEAEDGEIALELINEKKPDIILLDINMPFLNGINLLEKLEDANIKSIVIIISGYDDFSYAQRALKHNVFDYILKPVSKKQMEDVIIKALNRLNEESKETDYLKWMKKQLNENMDKLEENLFGEWLGGKISNDELLKEMKFFNIEFSNNIGIIVVNFIEKFSIEIMDKKWSTSLLKFAIINLISDIFKESDVKFVFSDDRNNIILISTIYDLLEWIDLKKELEIEIIKYLKINMIIEQANSGDGILKIKDEYVRIINDNNEKKKFSPITLATIKYIEEGYYSNELNINNISDKLEVTSSYLSKVLKKDTGLSFIDYLTKIRIKKAMYIMEDPTIKIYDVAELVGYSNQHYFCRAFKKIVGIFPTEYKRGK